MKPFLRWVGGKNWLIERLKNFIPAQYNNYHEPFIGGGSIYFSLFNHVKAYLSDNNNDLMNTYHQVKINPKNVLSILNSFENSETNYYIIRNCISSDKIYNAAKFIFLNRTCFNGVYRVNKQGKFNVPYGHDSNVKIIDAQHLMQVSSILKNSSLMTSDFEHTMENIKPNDLVFLDPPYSVAHGNNGFLEYNHKLFSWDDQLRLAEYIDKLNRKGTYFILTNAAHESIDFLYNDLGKKFVLERSSTITSRIEKRKKISEFLYTNCI